MKPSTDRALADFLEGVFGFLAIFLFWALNVALGATILVWLMTPPGKTKEEKDMEIYKQLKSMGQHERAEKYYHPPKEEK